MASDRYRIDDLMIVDTERGSKFYIRELLDSPSHQYNSSKLTTSEKIEIISALGLQTLIPVLEECFRRKGSSESAEYEAKFAWAIMNGRVPPA